MGSLLMHSKFTASYRNVSASCPTQRNMPQGKREDALDQGTEFPRIINNMSGRHRAAASLCARRSRRLEGLRDARNPYPASRAILEMQYEIDCRFAPGVGIVPTPAAKRPGQRRQMRMSPAHENSLLPSRFTGKKRLGKLDGLSGS